MFYTKKLLKSMYFRQIHSTNERERFFETESKVSLLMTLDDL